MAAVYAAADVVVCRAGAMTVAELAVAGVPSVLVPLPGAPGDHQTANARVLERAGAAVLLPDADCTPVGLGRERRGAAGRPRPARGHGPGRGIRWGVPTRPTPVPGWSRPTPDPDSGAGDGIDGDGAGATRDSATRSTLRRVHIVGIGGAGMSAIATVLRAMGHEVTRQRPARVGGDRAPPVAGDRRRHRARPRPTSATPTW